MEQPKKINKDFQLSDSSVNVYGFRLLTSGYVIEEFKRNPIGYNMHIREDGVLVRWEDLRVEGDKVLGKPVINMAHERGAQTVYEIENGFLNGGSVGHIVALEWSEDPKDMIPGQTGPTITKWYNRECSLCDIPGNMNSLSLYDKEGNQINLADFKTKKTILDMKEIKLSAAQLAKINLTDAATEAEVNAKLENLVAEAAKVPQLISDLAAANTAKKKAEDDLNDLKAMVTKNEVAALADGAVIDKKCTREMGEQLKADYANNPVGLKKLVDTMKPYESVVKKIETKEEHKSELQALAAKSGEDLYKEGKLERLKEIDTAGTVYKTKYKELFDEEPK
jgi:hypothetical protein